MKKVNYMDAVNFCYWLHGFAELTTETPTPEQWKSIKEHLALVFTKVTPKAPGNDPAPSILDDIFKPRPPKPMDDAIGYPWRDKLPMTPNGPWHTPPQQVIC